ncbi:MAG: hypothetical protein RLZZ171_1262 [Cyanobacteriota bacterium]|jgi:hypothetical protein
MIENVTDIDKLNNLLKDTQQKFKAWNEVIDMVGWHESSNIRREAEDSWRSLRTELNKNSPVQYVRTDGVHGTIGTIGCMGSDLMVYYGVTLHDWNTFCACHLLLIKGFVENEINLQNN